MLILQLGLYQVPHQNSNIRRQNNFQSIIRVLLSTFSDQEH